MSDECYGFGIVGLGMIAEFHAKAISAMPEANLVAVYSRRPEHGREFAARYGCVAYSDYQAFLAHDSLDVVTICTPSGAHLDPVQQAAAAGKHIVCEKPLEVTSERIDQMIAACDANNVMLAGIFPRRFNASTTLLKSAVDVQRFGTIAMADAYIKWWRTQDYYDQDAWRGTWALDGGGALMNQSIHTIDLLLHVMGDVKSVRAQTRLIAHAGIEVEDNAIAMLEFENGAQGVIQGSTACWSAQGHPAEVQISGSHGSAFMSDDRFKVWEFRNPQAQDEVIRRDFGLSDNVAGAGASDPSSIDFQWHQRNFEDVTHALRHQHPPSVDGKQARRAVALINAIYRSAAAGGEAQCIT